MSKYIHYIYILITLFLASCNRQELPTIAGATGILDLTLVRDNVPQVVSRAMDADLALTLTRPDGTLYKSFAPGEVPSKIQLEAGVVYTLLAYTDNQETWAYAMDGLGEACYKGETTVTVGEDETVYCTYSVPMTNYAATLTLPELFDDFFTAYTFTLTSGERRLTVKEGEKAYLAVSDGGFTYQLQATNTDGKTCRHSAIGYPEVMAGKLYNIKYIYATDFNSGGIDIDIEDNTEHEDVDISI